MALDVRKDSRALSDLLFRYPDEIQHVWVEKEHQTRASHFHHEQYFAMD